MNKIAFIVVGSLAAAALFSACTKEAADTTKPVIELIEPENGDSILIGDAEGMHLEMDLSDDVMLGSYKVDIHNNFDEHTHGAPAKSVGATTPFTYIHTWDVSGQRQAHIHHHDIVIPADATPGKYHFMVYCTDAAGNESYVARSIVLSTTAPSHGHDD